MARCTCCDMACFFVNAIAKLGGRVVRPAGARGVGTRPCECVYDGASREETGKVEEEEEDAPDGTAEATETCDSDGDGETGRLQDKPRPEPRPPPNPGAGQGESDCASPCVPPPWVRVCEMTRD